MDQKKPGAELEILTGRWADLAPHAERGAVFTVAPDLDLLDAAKALANDELTRVKDWLERKSIERPTPVFLATCARYPDREFRFIIVQPYVLIQDLGN